MKHRHPGAKPAKTLGSDRLFLKSCELVEPKLNPSKRQEQKWKQKRGAAYQNKYEAQRQIEQEDRAALEEAAPVVPATEELAA